MFLTPSELIELTDCKQKSAQIRWLKERRYPFEVGKSGHPKVLRETVFVRMQPKASPQLRFA